MAAHAMSERTMMRRVTNSSTGQMPAPYKLKDRPAQDQREVRVGCFRFLVQEVQKPLKDPSDFPRRRLSPAAPK
jgi:hypothetical protein